MSSETIGSSFMPPLTFQERFDNAQGYWKKVIDEGRAVNTDFYSQVFESEEAVIYREIADDELLMLIARTLNETWVGMTKSHGKIDTANR